MRARYSLLYQERYYKPLILIFFSILILFFYFSGIFQKILISHISRNEEINLLRRKYTLEESLTESIKYEYSRAKVSNNLQSKSIAIVMVITKETKIEDYDIAINTVRCYSKIHDYKFILAVDSDFNCPHKDKFFRRHCVAANILPSYSAVVFLDADIGIVNPKRKIEDFMNENIDIIFYDRFYNWEIMAGSYIVKNTDFSIKLLMDFANYEYKLPKSFHGTDNGALHLFLAEILFPNADEQLDICRKVYNNSKDFDDLFTYEACIRSIFGVGTDFGKIRIMKKGTGWSRDGWLTNWQWHPELDFMFHGWKTRQLLNTPKDEIKPIQSGRSNWYNPFEGPIHLDKCVPGNTTWLYETKLIGDKASIVKSLNAFEKTVAMNQIMSLSRIPGILFSVVS